MTIILCKEKKEEKDGIYFVFSNKSLHMPTIKSRNVMCMGRNWNGKWTKTAVKSHSSFF